MIVIHTIVALIRMPRKIRIAENVKPVKMPSNCDPIENIEAFVMGYGDTDAKKNKESLKLNFATLKILPSKNCLRTYPWLLFRKSVICASNDERKQSVYAGDSGG